MMRCATCKHWFKGVDDSNDTLEDENFNKVEYMGNCRSPKTVYVGQSSSGYAKDILGFYDYEGVEAGVITGENFGCVNYEERQ